MKTEATQICEDLLELLKHTKTHLFDVAEAQDLTPMQMSALYAISRGEGTMGNVAEALHCDASNVTGIIDRLVSRGLVMRHESEHDRRTRVIELTDDGQRVVNSIIKSLPERLGCDKLSQSECQSLHKIVGKIT